MACGSFLVGTCGFQRARSLHYKSLDAVEVQQTFYDPPPPERLSKWRTEAPEGFVFTVKAWMLITHGYNKRLWRRLKRELPFEPAEFKPFHTNKAVLWALEVTLEAARALGARVLVFQSPASFGATEENARLVASFFKEAGLENWEVYWEPRGSWWSQGRGLLERVASEAGIGIAGDVLRGRLPPRGQDALYARLHGLGGRGEVNYRYKYSDDDLQRLLDAISPWGGGYIMFNNVYAFNDARRFREMLCNKIASSRGQGEPGR
ncbi:MAG: DUF72 domain-containing protein [Desulfurococcales archaeon]|nr:DUF72 domain-containing protein [Desulfurococcales archaeon]